MEDNTTNFTSPIIDEQTAKSINEVCDLVLVYEDNLDFEKGKEYIEKHISTDIQLSGDRYGIRSIVQRKITHYIENCPSTIQLFVFASDSGYQIYRKQFNDHYYEYYYSTGRPHSSLIYPPELDIVFDCIQEAIDFHTLYQKFSIKMSDEAVQRAIDEASKASLEAANAASAAENAARVAAKIAQKAADVAADKAVASAIKQVIDEEKVEKRINDSVDKQMSRVTSRVSETSVTILGIFSGIVLTVVAGLFYSSSLLENINSANFFKLLCVASLVGLVCYHLIAAMFRFIEKFKKDSNEDISNVDDTPKKQSTKKDISNVDDTPKKQSTKKDHTIFISVVLIVIFIISCILQFFFPANNDSNASYTPSELAVNVGVVIDSNSKNTDETTSTEHEDDTEKKSEETTTSSNC